MNPQLQTNSRFQIWLLVSSLIGFAAVFLPLAAHAAGSAVNVVGSWKLMSHSATYAGSTFDSQAALLQQRPCAAKIRYNVNADGTYRLDASSSDCDEKYKSIQEKLYAKTMWKLEGNRITTSATNFAVGQSYTVTVSGNQMTWIGTDGQGTLVFQR
jgi:Lipocalin-like domain